MNLLLKNGNIFITPKHISICYMISPANTIYGANKIYNMYCQQLPLQSENHKCVHGFSKYNKIAPLYMKRVSINSLNEV